MKIKLATREVEVSSLTFRQVEAFSTEGVFDRCPLTKEGLIGPPERREAALTVILASLQRADPKVTRDELLDALDLESYDRVIAAVMGASRLVKRESGAGEG